MIDITLITFNNNNIDIFRYNCFKKLLNSLNANETGGLEKFSRSYEEYGVHVRPGGVVYCKEWCPGAKQLYLWGDFSKTQTSHSNSTLWHLKKIICGPDMYSRKTCTVKNISFPDLPFLLLTFIITCKSISFSSI